MPVCLALVPICAGCVTAGADRAVIRAKDRVSPALVHIRPVKEVFRGGEREEVSVVGSGFIISPDGYVVTNEHVAGQSTLVRCVLYNKEEVDAEVVGADRYTDLAVLKLKTDRKDLPAAKLASSKDLKAGQTVLALGSPHGLARSVSMGIVSVTDRYLGDRDEMMSPYNNWIQTDAAINPGNSGGPLVNLKGEVVGVNARRLGGAENVGFAIPIDIAKEVIEQIRKNGKVQRSWLGISVQETTSMTDDPAQKGVVIADIDPLSPAAEAGLQPGDVMLAIDGTPVNARFEEDLPAVRKLIADLPVNEQVTLHVQRAKQEIDIPVTTMALSDMKGKEIEFKAWGFTATELTPALVRRARLSSNKGVFISGTQVGGVAAEAGLNQGDIVLRVDETEIGDLDAFKEMVDARVASGQRLVLFEVKRGALFRYTLLKQNGARMPATGSGPAGQEGNGNEN